jgi:hypothetical protein
MMSGRGDPKVTGGKGPRDEPLPVFEAVETFEAEAVFGPGRSGRRGPGPQRGAGIAAALLVVLVAGIAVGSLPKAGDPTARPSPSPNESDGDLAFNPDPRPCEAPTFAKLPTLLISNAEQGISRYASFTTGYRADPNSPELPAPAWQVPRLAAAFRIQQPVLALEVASDLGACLGRLLFSYRPTDSLVDAPGTDLFSGDFEPPVRNLAVATLPPGDWVARVEAHFQAPDEPPGADIVTFSFFRIIVANVPVVSDPPTIAPTPPAPQVTPATACAPGSPKPGVEVLALGGVGEPVPGAIDLVPVPPVTPPGIPVVVMALGDPLELAITGNQCAISWDIKMEDPVSGDISQSDGLVNPTEGVAVGAQNHWQVNPIPDQELVASMRFAGGPSIVRSWLVKVRPFVTPPAFLVAKDGTRFEATAGCGLQLHLANGYTTSDGCGSTGFSPTAAALHVAAFEPIRFDIPGWSVQSWNAECGAMQATDTATFTNVNGCRLGAAVGETGTPLLAPAAFVLRAGDTIVQISVAAINANGDQFNLPFYAHVIAR